MTEDFINAAIAGVYECAARLVKASGDAGARKCVTSDAGRVVGQIMNLQEAQHLSPDKTVLPKEDPR
jgi:hypothetical protein